MKVIILASSLNGTAAHHLPYILKQKQVQITRVVYSEGKVLKDRKYYFKRLKKMFKIGVLGAANGIRMRKWYGADVKRYLDISSLEAICNDFEIPFYRTPTINCERTRQLFKEANAEVGISLGNGYIEKSVFCIPLFGMLNIHHEILPDYRNAQSIIWQLYSMSNQTGYTIHRISSKIDTGDILFAESIPIEFLGTLGATVTTTSALLLRASAKGLVFVLENFESLLANGKSQDTNSGRKFTTPSIWEFWRIYRNYKKLRTLGKPVILAR